MHVCANMHAGGQICPPACCLAHACTCLHVLPVHAATTSPPSCRSLLDRTCTPPLCGALAANFLVNSIPYLLLRHNHGSELSSRTRLALVACSVWRFMLLFSGALQIPGAVITAVSLKLEPVVHAHAVLHMFMHMCLWCIIIAGPVERHARHAHVLMVHPHCRACGAPCPSACSACTRSCGHSATHAWASPPLSSPPAHSSLWGLCWD